MFGQHVVVDTQRTSVVTQKDITAPETKFLQVHQSLKYFIFCNDMLNGTLLHFH